MSDIQRYSLKTYIWETMRKISYLSYLVAYSSHFTPSLCNNIIENVILGRGFQSEAYLRGGGRLSHPIIYCFRVFWSPNMGAEHPLGRRKFLNPPLFAISTILLKIAPFFTWLNFCCFRILLLSLVKNNITRPTSVLILVLQEPVRSVQEHPDHRRGQ